MAQRCTAHRSNGDSCRAWAVRGATVCVSHGGAAPAVRAAAARRVAEEKARRVALKVTGPVEVDPARALIDLVHSAAGEVAYWRAEVDRVQAEHPRQMTMGVTRVEQGTRERGVVDVKTIETVPHIAYRMWTEARERLARYATAALKAGIEERRVQLAEDQGALMAQVIRGILQDLDLTAEQQARSSEVAARHLRLVSQAA